MIWRQNFRLCVGGADVPAGWPRRVLRHLVLGHGLGVGSRVLDTGRDSGQLVRFLNGLHLEASSLPRGDEAVAGTVASAEDRYDLVIVRDLPAHRQSHSGAEAFEETADLLAQVSPGRCLSFLLHDGRAVDRVAADVERHLRRFPGTCITTTFSEGVMPVLPWQWITGHSPHGGFAMVTLRVPAAPLSREDWQRLGRSAASQVTAASGRRDVA